MVDKQTAAEASAAFERKQWFVERLAKENRWSLPYAGRVFEEYMRFIVLAAVHPGISPSPAVDKAWHLHIVDTHAYTAFCASVLRRSYLHHVPGSAADSDAARKGYKETLALYTQTFGALPRDIWPPATPEPWKHTGCVVACTVLSVIVIVYTGAAAWLSDGSTGSFFKCLAALIGGTVFLCIAISSWGKPTHGFGCGSS